MTFTRSLIATVKGKDGTGSNYTVAGTNSATTTPENAAAQIGKIFAIVGKTVTLPPMTRTILEVAEDDD